MKESLFKSMLSSAVKVYTEFKAWKKKEIKRKEIFIFIKKK